MYCSTAPKPVSRAAICMYAAAMIGCCQRNGLRRHKTWIIALKTMVYLLATPEAADKDSNQAVHMIQLSISIARHACQYASIQLSAL